MSPLRASPSSILTLLVGILACTGQTPGAVPDLRLPDRAVYRAVLDTMFVAHGSNSITQLVIVDSTSRYRLDGMGAEAVNDLYRIPGMDSSAIRDFGARNLKPYSLSYLPTLGLPLKVVLTTSESLRVVPGEGPEKYWDRFYDRFPHSSGSIILSAIGYNARRDVAVLMVEHGCGGLCGEGSIVVVKRDDGRWHLIAIKNMWAS